MQERGKFFGTLRNLATAAAIIPFSASGQVFHEQAGGDFGKVESVSQDYNKEKSFLEQFDEYLETDYGKALAASLFLFSVANSAYRLQKSRELDSDRKRGEAILSNAFLIALSLNFLAQTETDVDPRITVAFIDAFTIINSVYIGESTFETDRHWRKRLSSLVAVSSLVALSTIISLDTFDKS